MSEADGIRKCAFDDFIRPARQASLTVVAIAAKDVHDRLGLTSHFPNVCQALRGQKFREVHGVELLETIGPDPSSTTIFVYRI